MEMITDKTLQSNVKLNKILRNVTQIYWFLTIWALYVKLEDMLSEVRIAALCKNNRF